MDIKTLLLDQGHINRPGTILNKVTGCVIHWTANEGRGADAVANRNYFNRRYRVISGKFYETANDASGNPVKFVYGSAHLNVDDHQLTENLPWRKGVAEMGYHVGATTYRAGICDKLGTTYPNNATIGLEICVNVDGNFKQAYANGVKVMAMMLKEHGLGISALIRHYDVTGKICPSFFVDNGYAQKYLGMSASAAWSKFQADVQAELNGSGGGNTPMAYNKVYKDFELVKDGIADPAEAEALAKKLFIESGGKNGTIQAVNPDGSPLYTPSKHPEEFPQYAPAVSKERIHAESGKLKYINLNLGKAAYNYSGTDVRYTKLLNGKFKLKLVWEPGAKVSDLVKKYGADYGFNAPFFDRSTPIADCKIGDKILNVGWGKTTKWHGLAYKNGQPSIGMFNVNDSLGADGFLIKTTPLLVESGNLVYEMYRVNDETASDIGRDTSGNFVRAQRTFIGIDKDGNLMMAVSDGRASSDLGLTLEEMALYMQDKGATVALNFDGGSSSVLADESGVLGGNRGSNEHEVNHALLVFATKESDKPAPPPTPAPQQFYRLMYEGKQQGAYSVVENGQQAAKDLYRKTKSPNIVLNNPDGTPDYTPHKHPEDFPDLIVDPLNETTQKAIYEYLKKKFN